jgi:hypothetical protein
VKTLSQALEAEGIADPTVPKPRVFKATEAMVRAIKRDFPDSTTSRVGDEQVTEYFEGASGPEMTAKYVAEYCRRNILIVPPAPADYL